MAVRQHDCYSFVAGGGAEVIINIQQFYSVYVHQCVLDRSVHMLVKSRYLARYFPTQKVSKTGLPAQPMRP